MRFRSNPRPSPEHWSKDYVEHLRTVHFALVSVSVGLIIILSPKTYDPRAAATQIDRIVRLNSSWPQTELGNIAKTHDIPGKWNPKEFIPFRPWFGANIKSLHRSFTFHLSEPNIYFCSRNHEQYHRFTSTERPQDLETFAEWWNELRKYPFVLDSFEVLDPHGLVIGPLDSNGTVSEGGVRESFTIDADTPIDRERAVEMTADPDFCEYPEVSREVPILIKGWNEGFRFSFAVVAIKRVYISQPGYELSAYWQQSSTVEQIRRRDHFQYFEEAFPDLAIAARDRGEEQLSTLALELHADGNKGEEPFEVFGMKFPGELVLRWGIVVLVGVQLYFVMYMRQLFNKLRPDDPGWDVPWMAMDRSRLARASLFFSIVVLPACAASLLAISAKITSLTTHDLGYGYLRIQESFKCYYWISGSF